MPLTFRFATGSDLPLVAQMNEELLQAQGSTHEMSVRELVDRLAKWLAEGHRIVLWELESQPIGYALFSYGERLGERLVYLRHFLVKKEHRRKGYGRRAMQHLQREIWPRGIPVYVDTSYTNRDALEFWESLQFEIFSLTLVRRALNP